MTPKPRILVTDIETSPHKGYFWRLRDENIGLDQLEEPSRMICFAAKWHGEAGEEFHAEWFGGRRKMLRRLRALLAEADAVVTYNGDKFDLPKINGEFVAEGILPAPPVASIDLYKTVKSLGYASGKLEYVAPFLAIGAKLKHEGFTLWREVMQKDPAARMRMERYNRQDVILTDRLYEKLRPYIANHPALHGPGCVACGSKSFQSRGWRKARMFETQRLECQACGKWNTGIRRKIK